MELMTSVVLPEAQNGTVPVLWQWMCRQERGCPFDLVACCIRLIRCLRLPTCLPMPVPPRCRFALVGAARRCRRPGARTAARLEAAE